jgi:lysyl-tRNA synthetase class 2
MSAIDEIREERIKKIALLKAAGMDPYPADSNRTHDIAAVLESFDTLLDEKTALTIAGRVRSRRGQGGIIFIDLEDGSARMQALLKKDEMQEDLFDLFEKVIDTGDIIEVAGTAFVTKRGEKSVLGEGWRMLTKSLQPVPDEWYGLKDEDERYRKRYLSILLNPEERDIVIKRAKFWRAVRTFHEQNGFLEVQTPILETTTGGADANPFVTHHHALDMDVYLRISAGELWQKRLMVAGLPKTFEIGRIFRNEGMSAEHAQDYEQCEGYWAYADFKKMYMFLKECYQFVAEETFGTLRFKIRGFDVDLSGEWPTIDYSEEIKRQTSIDIWNNTDDTIREKLSDLSVTFEDGAGRERLIDTLWKYCRKNIGGPAILINEPKITSPLAKSLPEQPELTQRFHFIIAGSEVGQGYSELNDPIDQRERFERQQALRDAGDKEAQMADMEFVEALEYGMPPTAGHGFSERLFSFLMDKPIRETQIFPLMKPRN